MIDDIQNERRMSVMGALQWAFGTECARLDLPDKRPLEEQIHANGFGTEWVLIQRARLGGRVDCSGGGRSDPHPDADIIASFCETSRYGPLGAIMLAQYGKSGLEPDWIPADEMICEPLRWTVEGRHAERKIIRQYVEHFKIPHPKDRRKRIKRTRKIKEEYCPIHFIPEWQEVETARAEYTMWWNALDDLRERLHGAGLTRIELTDRMPAQKPWETRISRKG